MDESVHMSLERYVRMQETMIELKTARLKDAKEMLEMCMSAIYQMALKIEPPPISSTMVPRKIEQIAEDWVKAFCETQEQSWTIRWRVSDNLIEIIELIPQQKTPRHDSQRVH